jgi:acyl carrier protein
MEMNRPSRPGTGESALMETAPQTQPQEAPGSQTPAERELAELIVASLGIDWVAAADIDPQAALFGGDLGLDSIDALELALAISRRYGFQLRSDDPDNRRIFSNLRELAAHVERHRVAATG